MEQEFNLTPIPVLERYRDMDFKYEAFLTCPNCRQTTLASLNLFWEAVKCDRCQIIVTVNPNFLIEA